MLERDGQYSFDHALHGGSGSMTVQWHFFDECRLPVAVQTWTLPPGASEGMHTHDPDNEPLDELYLVVSGTGLMHVNDEVYDINSGDSVLTPAGASHDLVNTGDDPLRVVVVWGKPGEAEWSHFGTAKKARAARG